MPLRIVALSLALGMLWAASAAAEPARSDADGAPPGYDQSVQRALREFELANYAEARAMLLSAHELYPNARTLRALGMVEYELKNYPACVAYMEQALSSRERPLNAEQRTSAEELRRAAEAYLSRYTLQLRPSNARVLLDGEPVSFDSQGKLVLAVGDHQLEVSAEGHHTLQRKLKVDGGEQRTLDVVLVPVTQAEPRAANGAQGSVDQPLYKKWWLWTTVGLVVAGGAVAGTMLALRKDDPQQPNGGSINETIHLLQVRR